MHLIRLIDYYGKNLIFLFLIIIFVHVWFISYGTGSLIGEEVLSKAFDSLAKNLIKGSVEVDKSAIGFEAFIVNGKYYTNYAPFPAFVKLILISIAPFYYGKLSRISCLIASILSVIAFTLLIHELLSKNNALSLSQRKNLFYTSTMGFSLGSPLIFSVNCTYFYSEGRIWAICASLWGLYYLFSILENDKVSKIKLFAFSICTGASLCAKESHGLSLYFILPILLIVFITRSYKNKLNNIKATLLTVFILISPAILFLSIQLYYNHTRFGSIFQCSDYNYYAPWLYSPKEKLRVENTGGIFNIMRLPFTLTNYFGFNLNYFSKDFPFIMLKLNIPSITCLKDLYEKLYPYYGGSQCTIPLTIISPWILLGSLFGSFWLLRNKSLRLHLLCAFPFLFSTFPVLTFYYLSQRYISEVMPYLVFTYSIFLLKLGSSGFTKNNLNKIITFLRITCILSILFTILSTLSYCAYLSWATPVEYRNSLKLFFNKINSLTINQPKSIIELINQIQI